MTIGRAIKEYREKNKYSMRDFAAKCGVSHSYIAMLESEKNSKTGGPIVPSITALNKIAHGLDTTINYLFSICDDMPVSLSEMSKKEIPPDELKLREGEEEWLSLFKLIPEEQRADAVVYVRSALKIAGLLR